MKKIIIIIFIMLIGGCYDKREMNDILILTATEVDKVDNTYKVKTQVINPKASNQDKVNKEPFIIYMGEGDSLQSAYRSIKGKSSRSIYPDHIQIMLINENMAKEGISDIFDFYLREVTVRTEFKVLVSKDSDILEIVPYIDEINSESILGTVNTNNRYLGVSNIVSFNDITSMYLNPRREIVIPSIRKNSEKMYEIDGLAIFKDDRLIGYLDKDEAMVYNMVLGNAWNNVITYYCNDETLSAEVISNKPVIKSTDKGIEINLDIELVINEDNCYHDLDNPDVFDKANKDIQEYIEKNIYSEIEQIREEYNSDIFGFLDEIYRHNYKKYLEVAPNWYNYEYQNMDIKVLVNSKIMGKGNR